jgi:iron complex outermembrane recepter protein
VTLPKAPEMSASIALSYYEDFSLGELNAHLSYSHRDTFASRVFGDVGINQTPASNLINLSVDFSPANYSDVNIALIVTNLADKDTVNSRWTNNFGVQSISEEFVAPRQVIAKVSYKF